MEAGWQPIAGVQKLKRFNKSNSKSGPNRRQLEGEASTIMTSNTQNTTLEEDLETLLAVKEALEGTASLNWKVGIPAGKWVGVQVTGGRVTELNLRKRRLTGIISPSLGQLSALEKLVLENNQLIGSIPPTIGSLSCLKDLWLKHNQLTGGIPEELGGLKNLERFTAINNRLTGNIPDSIGNLSNLQELWLGNNRLTGEIPASFGNLVNLRELWLRNNRLTGSIPEEVRQLPNLQRLVIDKNEFADHRGEGSPKRGKPRRRGPKLEEAQEEGNPAPTEGKRRKKKGKYNKEYSKKWESGDAEATEFFVYILKLDGNIFYAGQTRELRERLMEHRDGDTISTAGRNPKLVWFTKVSSRDEATTIEADLKRLCDQNPREVRRKVRHFRDLVEELDFS